MPLNSFLSTAADERIVGIAAMREQNGDSVTLVTRHGEIKRVAMADLVGTRASGIGVLDLEKGDEVVWAGATVAGQEIIIVSAQGKSIRFEPESELRASGRGSGGVRAIKLDGDDRVVAADLVDKDGFLMVMTGLGAGKRSPLSDYSAQGRGGGGIMTAAISDKSGPIAAARVITPGDDVLLISVQGQVVRRSFDDVPALARAHRGSPLVEVEKGDRAAVIVRLRPDKKSPAALPVGDGSAAPPDKAPRRKPAATAAEAPPAAKKATKAATTAAATTTPTPAAKKATKAATTAAATTTPPPAAKKATQGRDDCCCDDDTAARSQESHQGRDDCCCDDDTAAHSQESHQGRDDCCCDGDTAARSQESHEGRDGLCCDRCNTTASVLGTCRSRRHASAI